MMRRLAKRIQLLDEEIAEANRELDAILANHAPNLLAIDGVGTEAAGQILATAGENVDRLKSEASLARLCGVAPIPASTGNTTRHRLHRGGDRDANCSIHLIVVNRLRWHEPTKRYVTRRTQEGKPRRKSSAASNEPSSANSTEHCKLTYVGHRTPLTLHGSIHTVPFPLGPTHPSNCKLLCRYQQRLSNTHSECPGRSLWVP